MQIAYKLRVYPNKAQKELLTKTFGCCRFVYNYYLAIRIERYKETGETLNYYACSNDLPNLKQKYEWLKEVDATALQSSLKDLDIAYKNFFKDKKVGFPKFKSKKIHRYSYKSRQVASIKYDDKKNQST